MIKYSDIFDKIKSIYKKVHKITAESIMTKVAIGLGTGLYGLASVAVVAGFAVGFDAVTLGIALGSTSFGFALNKASFKNFVHGIYSDATKEQRLFYDGRHNYDSTIQDKSQIKGENTSLKY